MKNFSLILYFLARKFLGYGSVPQITWQIGYLSFTDLRFGENDRATFLIAQIKENLTIHNNSVELIFILLKRTCSLKVQTNCMHVTVKDSTPTPTGVCFLLFAIFLCKSLNFN